MGRRTPLDDEPEFDWEVQDYLIAFSRLSSSRPFGMDAGALVLSEIAFYWQHIDSIGLLNDFIDIMQQIDAIFLKHRADNRPNNG